MGGGWINTLTLIALFNSRNTKPRSRAASWVSNLCNCMGPHAWKYPALDFMLCCCHFVTEYFSTRFSHSLFIFALSSANYVASPAPISCLLCNIITNIIMQVNSPWSSNQGLPMLVPTGTSTSGKDCSRWVREPAGGAATAVSRKPWAASLCFC